MDLSTVLTTPKESSKISSPAMIQKPILKWQYEVLVKELLLLQGHSSDPSCPCQSEGEACIRKHLLTIEALAEETVAIEPDEDKKYFLNILTNEAKEHRKLEEQKLCGKEVESEDLAEWARDKRKQIEEYSLACSLMETEKEGIIYCCQSRTKPSGEVLLRCTENGQSIEGLYPSEKEAKEEAVSWCSGAKE